MDSVLTVLKRIAGTFFTFLFTGLFGVYAIPGGTGKPLAAVPADFTPVLRFAVCSDIHLNGDPAQDNAVKFAAMLRDAYAYADTCDYKGLDAVLVAGDMTGGGRPAEYASFNRVTSENLRDGTRLLVCLGNHEFIAYRDDDATVGYEVYKQYVSETTDTHVVINGFHFIGVSYADDGKTFTGKLDWLRAQLDAAVAEDPTKPVFVFQHPHPFLTVYGSVNWADVSIKTTLAKYPQVVDFSGHSHYAANDPRSVWQGSFTAVGAGAITGLMANPSYLDDFDAPGESGSYWVAEVDAAGNVRLRLADVVGHRFFANVDYYLSSVADKKAHTYTWGNLRSLDTAPAFPAGATVTASQNEAGETLLAFPDAAAYFITETYRIRISDAKGLPVRTQTVLADFVRADADGVSVNLGSLERGAYTVRVTPVSAFSKAGRAITGDFVID